VALCEAGETLALSSLTDVRDSILTVTDKQKFLLIQISREIEAMALTAGEGVLHSGFQYLSRLDDERETLAAHERLGDADLDVHVYGAPDADPIDYPGVDCDGDDGEEITHSWFVVFTTDRDGPREAALVAHEREPEHWDGFWTFDPELVAEVEAYVESAYLDA
jgi:DICT domain-containing protein